MRIRDALRDPALWRRMGYMWLTETAPFLMAGSMIGLTINYFATRTVPAGSLLFFAFTVTLALFGQIVRLRLGPRRKGRP